MKTPLGKRVVRQSPGKQVAKTSGPFSFSKNNFSPIMDFKSTTKIDEDDLDRNEFNWSNRDLLQLRKERNSVLKSEPKNINDQ